MKEKTDVGGNGKIERKTVAGAKEAIRLCSDFLLNQSICVCMISILPETEIALTPLLTASNFFSLLDTLEKRRKTNKLDNNNTTVKVVTNAQM